MTLIIGSQTDVPGPGDPIVSPWYQDTALKLVHTFANATARDAWTTRPTGAIAVTTDDKQLWFWNGTVWRTIPGVLPLAGGDLTGNLSIRKVDATLYFYNELNALQSYLGQQGNVTNLAAGGGGLRILVGGTDRIGITSTGLPLIHKLSSNLQVPGVEFPGLGAVQITQSVAAVNLTCYKNGTSVGNGQVFAQWFNATTSCGGVTMTAGLNGVAYGTSSDRRLKNDLGPVTDGLDRLLQLRPRRITWKGAEHVGTEEALIADEVDAVVPYAVVGEPNAVAGPPNTDDDGTPNPTAPAEGTPLYQQLDYSKLAPLTIAAVQQLAGLVESLTARLDALEAAA